MKKEHPWEALVIKDKDLVCKLGDTLKLIRDIECSNWESDDMTNYTGSGQLYQVDDRKGAGWDLIRISGDGPSTLRVMNSQVFDYFELVEPPEQASVESKSERKQID